MFFSSVLPGNVLANATLLLNTPPNQVRVYDKYEIKFLVNTESNYPFFQFDNNPPPGVKPGIGITVEGIFKKRENGKKWEHPAFYMTEVNRISVPGTNSNTAKIHFTETGNKYWALRFSPQDEGTYDVSIRIKDSVQDVTEKIGSFTTLPPLKKGFIKVSKKDSRYFEYSNGEIFWPIGPAMISRFDRTDYSSLKNSGQNFERPWLGGLGIYSTNWSRWKSSAQRSGNEGWSSVFDPYNKNKDSDLSYPIYYPQGYKMWLTIFGDNLFGPRIKKGQKYQYKLTLKTNSIAGPRNSDHPFGFVIRATAGDGWRPTESIESFENFARNQSIVVSHITLNENWQTITGTYTPTKDESNFFLYLDNVTAGKVYIDEFSLKEILPNGSLGGEVIRNSKADQHTYVEQRPAAYLDWQIEQAEKNDIFLKLVVHDKNDWIQNHLKTTGEFVLPKGDGYYQPENTKARWLMRQWYRYLVARWGYSTAIHSWELNNEGHPGTEDYDPGPAGIAHYQTAEEFGKYLHQIDAHPHLTTTSFWCCWRPTFWQQSKHLDYADLHQYSEDRLEDQINSTYTYAYDMALWNYDVAQVIAQKPVNKPVMRAETGIMEPGRNVQSSDLLKVNPGVWYHNLLWSQIGPYPLFDTGYFFTRHFYDKDGNKIINKEAISKVFFNFVSTLDVNQGGYVDLAANVSNPKIRVWGQKNYVKQKAFFWIQNSDHTWKNVLNGIKSSESANISIFLNPRTEYIIDWWNTCSERETSGCTGGIIKTETKTSGTRGKIELTVNDLVDDVAVKISSQAPPPSSTPTPTTKPSITLSPTSSVTNSPTPTQYLKPGDANGDSFVDGMDYIIWLKNYGREVSGGRPDGDFNNPPDGKVDGLDYIIWLSNIT